MFSTSHIRKIGRRTPFVSLLLIVPCDRLLMHLTVWGKLRASCYSNISPQTSRYSWQPWVRIMVSNTYVLMAMPFPFGISSAQWQLPSSESGHIVSEIIRFGRQHRALYKPVRMAWYRLMVLSCTLNCDSWLISKCIIMYECKRGPKYRVDGSVKHSHKKNTIQSIIHHWGCYKFHDVLSILV